MYFNLIRHTLLINLFRLIIIFVCLFLVVKTGTYLRGQTLASNAEEEERIGTFYHQGEGSQACQPT